MAEKIEETKKVDGQENEAAKPEETKPEKETLKDKAIKAYNKEITFTPKKVVTTALKIIGGAAAVIGIAGYAYNRGQNEALAMQANETYPPELPGNTGETDGFNSTGEDVAAFDPEPVDTTFENEPSEV